MLEEPAATAPATTTAPASTNPDAPTAPATTAAPASTNPDAPTAPAGATAPASPSSGSAGAAKTPAAQGSEVPPISNQLPPTPGFVKTAADSVSTKGTAGADGKYHIKDAQTQVDYLDERTEVAHNRYPYKSTLMELNDPVSWQGAGVAFPPVPPVPGFVGTAAATATNLDKKGADGKAAIIDAQESEKFADEATDKA